MLRRFAFTVYDTPRPQARPRFARLPGGKVHTYTPKGDQENRNNIRDAFIEVTTEPWEPLSGPIRLTVVAWLPMPASIPKKRRNTALPTKRPDLDNYVKQVQDALNHYAFVDDSQIVFIEAHKRYAGQPGCPPIPCWGIILEQIEI